jgi:tRNA threonylcarbamoyladenosine biosynthesis protein TsaE
VLVTRSAEQTRRVGELLGPQLKPGDVVALTGDLGAGKTCLVQGVAHGLGVAEPVTSPTFNILLVHRGRIPLYHFDLYRLEEENDLDDIGFYETVEGDGASMIEWGERFASALPPDHLTVTIRLEGDDSRYLEIEPRGERSRALAAAWLRACAEEGFDA